MHRVWHNANIINCVRRNEEFTSEVTYTFRKTFPVSTLRTRVDDYVIRRSLISGPYMHDGPKNQVKLINLFSDFLKSFQFQKEYWHLSWVSFSPNKLNFIVYDINQLYIILCPE